jgi:hypothetical protein
MFICLIFLSNDFIQDFQTSSTSLLATPNDSTTSLPGTARGTSGSPLKQTGLPIALAVPAPTIAAVHVYLFDFPFQ